MPGNTRCSLLGTTPSLHLLLAHLQCEHLASFPSFGMVFVVGMGLGRGAVQLCSLPRWELRAACSLMDEPRL